jgi:hypothetical protein
LPKKIFELNRCELSGQFILSLQSAKVKNGGVIPPLPMHLHGIELNYIIKYRNIFYITTDFVILVVAIIAGTMKCRKLRWAALVAHVEGAQNCLLILIDCWTSWNTEDKVVE